MAVASRSEHHHNGLGSCGLCNRTWPCPASTRKPKHVVADGPHYVHGGNSDLAPVTCACGWKGEVREWESHKRQS